jgi:hypothetical protein
MRRAGRMYLRANQDPGLLGAVASGRPDVSLRESSCVDCSMPGERTARKLDRSCGLDAACCHHGAPPKRAARPRAEEPARNRADRSRSAATAVVSAGTMPLRSRMRGGPATERVGGAPQRGTPVAARQVETAASCAASDGGSRPRRGSSRSRDLRRGRLAWTKGCRMPCRAMSGRRTVTSRQSHAPSVSQIDRVSAARGPKSCWSQRNSSCANGHWLGMGEAVSKRRAIAPLHPHPLHVRFFQASYQV